MTNRICLHALDKLLPSIHAAVPVVVLAAISPQTYVLGAAESDTGDARHAGQVQLLEGLAGFLLVAGVDNGGRASGEVSLAIFDVGFVAAVVLVDGRTLGLVVGKLFDSGVGHCD